MSRTMAHQMGLSTVVGEVLFGHSVDWVVGVATLLLAAVTLGLAGATVWLAVIAQRGRKDSQEQLGELRAQVEAARASHELAQRSLAAAYQPLLVERRTPSGEYGPFVVAARSEEVLVQLVLRNVGRGPAIVKQSWLARPGEGGWAPGTADDRTVAVGEEIAIEFLDEDPALVAAAAADEPLRATVVYTNVTRDGTWSADVIMARRQGVNWYARGGVLTTDGVAERTTTLSGPAG